MCEKMSRDQKGEGGKDVDGKVNERRRATITET